MADTKAKVVDFEISGGGTIFLVTPLTDAARLWVADNVNLESWQWFGGGFAVEHRYITDIYKGIVDAGFTVR